MRDTPSSPRQEPMSAASSLSAGRPALASACPERTQTPTSLPVWDSLCMVAPAPSTSSSGCATTIRYDMGSPSLAVSAPAFPIFAARKLQKVKNKQIVSK